MKTVGLVPVANSKATLLVVGTFPGAESLLVREYFANRRNRFWGVAAEIWDVDPISKYSVRCVQLIKNGIALWDVIGSCERKGSLDARIRDGSANDFVGFLRAHRRIGTICFNGKKAERLFKKLVVPLLSSPFASIHRISLPSTSAANTRFRFEDLVKEWSVVTEH